jgi:hypothetical protein
MDYTRDKRYPIGEGQIKPKKGVPKEVLQALVNLNSLTSHILATYNKPPEDHERASTLSGLPSKLSAVNIHI